MPSVIALRALLGAGLGLGALDVVWINAALAPRLVSSPEQAAPAVMPMQVEAHAAPPPNTAPPATEPPPNEAAPANEPPAAQDTTITERVYFETASAVLDARARTTLARVAAAARPDATFALEGHADYRGAESRNKTLSKERAVAVQHQLMRLGIERTRIHVDYAGEGPSTGQLWRDRRVDIQLTRGTR